MVITRQRKTLQFEKDSVHFFVGIKEMVPDADGKREPDKLIAEEMDHIRMLSQARKKCLPTSCDIIG